MSATVAEPVAARDPASVAAEAEGPLLFPEQLGSSNSKEAKQSSPNPRKVAFMVAS